ncbi:MAG: class I SAM-dependent methyltransferase [Promethearchaeota archaeon]|jgi:ubiquinone/menaquinone biosynthesis C-methylase UbiE
MKNKEHLNWSTRNPEEFLLGAQNYPIRGLVEERIKSLIFKHNYKQILEIGFGNAKFYERLQTFLKINDCSYTGLDITESFVQYAKSKFPETKWFTGDCRDMRFKNKQFDLSFMFHVLEHQKNLRDLSEAILETCRVTKSHILIVWFLPPHFKPSHREISQSPVGFYYYWTWNFNEVRELIEMSDFEIKSLFWANPKRNICWQLEAL